MKRGDRACEEIARALRGCVYAQTAHTCCKAVIASGKLRKGGIPCTDHLARVQARSSPCRCVCSAAVKTPSANPVVQFNRSIVRIYGVTRLLPGVVASDLMSATRYLGWHYMRGGNTIWCTCSAFVGWRVMKLCPWLNTIQGVRVAWRLLVICTRALGLGTWITDIVI